MRTIQIHSEITLKRLRVSEEDYIYVDEEHYYIDGYRPARGIAVYHIDKAKAEEMIMHLQRLIELVQ